jgi:hypothetical protein
MPPNASNLTLDPFESTPRGIPAPNCFVGLPSREGWNCSLELLIFSEYRLSAI